MRLALVVAVRIHCFAVDIVVAGPAAAEAGCTVAAAGAGCIVAAVAATTADIAAAVAASAEGVVGCTSAFAAAAAEAGCTDLGLWAGLDWMNRYHYRCGFDRHRFVLRNVVGPREPVGFLRGRVLAGRGWATKS